MFHRAPSRGGRGRRAAVDFVVCFSVGCFFSCFFFSFFSSNAHGLLQVRGRVASFSSLLPACSAMNTNTPQPRTLEVSLVWAREDMAIRTHTNVVLFVLSSWFIKMICGSHAFFGLQHKNLYFQKWKSLMRLFTKCNFSVHDFSEAPSAAGTEPNELSPVAAGREGIGRKTSPVVINNTTSNGHRLTGDALGALSTRL